MAPKDMSLEKQLERQFQPAAAVLEGVVISITQGEIDLFPEIKPKRLVPQNRIDLEVEQVWKGGRLPIISVWTGLGHGDCGYRFEVGKRYIVFAYKDADTLQTNICVWTGAHEESLTTIKMLGAPKWVPPRNNKKR